MTPSDRRLHPLSFFFSLGNNVRSLIIPGLLAFMAARSANWQVWLMLLFIPYTIAAVFRYLTFRYRFDDDELVIRTGLIFRNERHIPYARIHNIGSVQNLFHRMLRVIEARVETAGGQEPEATIQVISRDAMEEMRRRIFEEKRRSRERQRGVLPEGPAGAPAGVAQEPAAEPEPARTLLRLSPEELAVHGIVDNRGMLVLAAVLGVVWELGWQGGWPVIGNPWEGLFRKAAPFLSVAAGVVIILGGFIVLWICLRILSVGWALVRLHDFHLQLEGRDLRWSCGLLTRLSASIPLHRIQVLTITERPLARLFGRAEIRVDTAGGRTDRETSITHERIAPIVRVAEIPALLRVLQPDVDLSAVAWRSVDPRAWRRLLKPYLIIATGISAGPVALLGWRGLAVFVVLIGLAVLNAIVQPRHIGWAITDGYVLYRSGWIRRRVSMARHGKIQALVMTESPFDRRYRMAGLKVDTAGAGSASHQIHVPFLLKENARGAFDFLSARAARTAFRW